MIKELTQFIYTVPEIIKERALEPKAGLHILIKFDEEGNAHILGSERYLGKKHGETSQFLKECAKKQESAWMIDTNKCFDLPAKGIHSASPFCVAFKRESWIGGEKYPKDSTKPNIKERLEGYFSKTFDIKFKLDDLEKQKAVQFKNFLQNQLDEILNKLPAYEELDASNYIIFYKDEPIEKYINFKELYIADGLFNTSEFNIEVEDQILGTSNFYNGFNSKKPFLTHQTAAFDITGRISAQEAKALTEFQLYANKRLLPNPLPIFIDEPELTEKAIQYFHRTENQKLSHRDIIRELLFKKQKDIGNYYLLYITTGKKVELKDFEYISKFQYLLSNVKDEDGNPKRWIIENVTENEKYINKKEQELVKAIYLTDVFDFEREVIGRLFDYKLVNYDEEKGATFKYFEEIESKWYRPTMFSLMLKYRKPVYDFIYKSMRSSLGWQQFTDICMAGIMDDLKENKANTIRSKLNIYFSLCQYFANNLNQSIMPNKIEEYKIRLLEVLENDDLHYHHENDAELFAFGAGQLIYFLLDQSETNEKTHALLEPFLQKTTAKPFQDAIINTFNKYKHKLSLRRKKLNKLLSETLGFPIKEGQLTELRATLLVGYFCPNIFYTKKTESQN
ncbi:hypothetical protein [Mongoliitalea lutea]|uniref:CRISPR-associated protein Csh1 n=1 Tax=Mongoliitalea lutea TaxID=849756 RepID=A0A8J3G3V7_9BACT|nr:hypothetical protein [Mongoliitalea lutea]GHB25890.1 hypothetical protein GCM10008106_03330 [Mongoliitalea lutea]